MSGYISPRSKGLQKHFNKYSSKRNISKRKRIPPIYIKHTTFYTEEEVQKKLRRFHEERTGERVSEETRITYFVNGVDMTSPMRYSIYKRMGKSGNIYLSVEEDKEFVDCITNEFSLDEINRFLNLLPISRGWDSYNFYHRIFLNAKFDKEREIEELYDKKMEMRMVVGVVGGLFLLIFALGNTNNTNIQQKKIDPLSQSYFSHLESKLRPEYAPQLKLEDVIGNEQYNIFFENCGKRLYLVIDGKPTADYQDVLRFLGK